jgi:hypothetical protein
MRKIAKGLLGIALVAIAANSIGQAQGRWRGPDWQTFAVADFGTRVDYPAGIFSVNDGEADKGIGQKFSSADGSALLTVYSSANDTGETPMSYLRNNLRLPRAALDYERVTRSFFAISSTRQGLIFYSRCNFSADAALASEASGQRGNSIEVRAHSASKDARERADDTRPEPGSSARAGRAIHCFDLVYPSQHKRAWDDIVTRISRSLRPLEG